LIKETADALVSSGLSELGFVHLNLDDCWHSAQRDSKGRVQADPTRFPSGLKALGDYIHSKGLKFGIYSSAGFKTCQGFPASLGLEQIDVQSYVDWGVDYLKYDNCYQDYGKPETRYAVMSDALQNTGRDIFYSLCEWGRENPAVWASDIGAQSWRISGDISDDWKSIVSRAEITASLWRYSGPGRGWNDPDMLEVGNGKCNTDEYQSHFSLWTILKSPLIIGNDIRSMSLDVLEMLSNKEVIAINQDALGRQGRIT
jgi:alpha-galactosidase